MFGRAVEAVEGVGGSLPLAGACSELVMVGHGRSQL